MSVRVNVRVSKIMRTPIKVGVCVRVFISFHNKCNARDQVSDVVLRKLLCREPSSPRHRQS